MGDDKMITFDSIGNGVGLVVRGGGGVGPP